MARRERPTASRPGPMPPYQALTMIAGMNGVPRIPRRFSASVTSNARTTLALATPYRRINETDRPGARRRLQMAPLTCAAQEECLEAGGPLTSVTGPEHSGPPRTMPGGARFALLVGMTTRPPFTQESAAQKVRLAEDGWNSRDPGKVAQAYTLDSRWRNRSEFVNGRPEIIAFLARKWNKELDYRLIKELWAFGGHRIAVRFAYEWHDDSGNWYRSYGNENWEFEENGLMRLRLACINDLPITESDRKYRWPLGRRPDGHPGLTDLGL